jgi:methylmalonyl-CoA mutase N-terminal domain/subunit
MKITTRTESGIEIKDDYGPPADAADPRIGVPGEYPFTRGIHKTMYRDRLWTIRQYSGFGDAAASNERYRSLLAAGQTGLSVAFDLPTQMGYDSDDPMAVPEVGRVGVAIDSLDDLERLFDGIPLDVASTSFTINATAPVLVAMYVAMARRRGVDLTLLRGTVQNDILKEFLTRGAYVFPPDASLKLAVDVIEYCTNVAPSFYPISICGSHIRDTGAPGVDALATTLADGIAYLSAAADRGLDISKVASRFTFLFCSRQDPLVEAAHYRAARRLWATLLHERFSITDPNALKWRLFAGVSNSICTRQEPLNNIVRGTLGCLGIVLGGGQAINVTGYDEAFDIPAEDAQLIALRTQQIIAYETNIPATVDPLAGSYYVEALTDEIEERMRDFMDQIQEQGGVLEAIESGWLQQRIYDSAYELERGVANGDIPIVGVNVFTTHSEGDDALFALEGDLHEQDDSIAEKQAERLSELRASRDAVVCANALDAVRVAALAGDNVIPALEAAVTAGATVGECMGILKGVFGTYQEGGKF